MAPASICEHAIAPTKVLLVDDDTDSRDMLKILLERDGQDVAVASDGDDGIALART